MWGDLQWANGSRRPHTTMWWRDSFTTSETRSTKQKATAQSQTCKFSEPDVVLRLSCRKSGKIITKATPVQTSADPLVFGGGQKQDGRPLANLGQTITDPPHIGSRKFSQSASMRRSTPPPPGREERSRQASLRAAEKAASQHLSDYQAPLYLTLLTENCGLLISVSLALCLSVSVSPLCRSDAHSIDSRRLKRKRTLRGWL